MEPEYVGRIRDELKDLNEKIEKLDAFILKQDDPNCETCVSKGQKNLLILQAKTMETYNIILVARLEEMGFSA